MVKLVSRSLIQQRNIMKKYKGFWVCEIHADNFSTSSYFGDGEGFPTVGYDIEAESVEDQGLEISPVPIIKFLMGYS